MSDRPARHPSDDRGPDPRGRGTPISIASAAALATSRVSDAGSDRRLSADRGQPLALNVVSAAASVVSVPPGGLTPSRPGPAASHEVEKGRKRADWFPEPSGPVNLGINYLPYVLQGGGLFERWRDQNSTAAGPIYGAGIALAGLPGLKAVGEEAYVLWKGGRPNYQRMAAGVAEAAFAGSYGWYNAMGQNPAAGGFSAVLHGAAALYRDAQHPGRIADTSGGTILPLHHQPAAPNPHCAAAAIDTTSRQARSNRPSSPPSRSTPAYTPSPGRTARSLPPAATR